MKQRQVYNPVGMAQPPMRTICYSKTGSWWDVDEHNTCENAIQVPYDLEDWEIVEIVQIANTCDVVNEFRI